jgi:hypothetical protein
VLLLGDGKLSPSYAWVSFKLEELLTDVLSVLCSDMAIKQVDEPFVSAKDNVDEWIL